MAKKAKLDPQKIVDEVLELLASKEGLTIGQGADLLEEAGRQIRRGMHELMASELAKPVAGRFEAKPDIKVCSSIH